MTVTQNYPGELGAVVWPMLSPTKPQTGTIIANAGKVPQNVSTAAKATYNAVIQYPHSPASWKVR